MGNKSRNLRKLNPWLNKPANAPLVTSFLDVMKDGREFESIATLPNVQVDVKTEIQRSLLELSSVRKRPVICYVANVLNAANLNCSISLDNSDELPFLEMLQNVAEGERKLDIILVTPGGSAETVAHMVEQIRSRFDSVAFILPNIAMSAGTIFCMSGDELIMAESACIGPIDPQVLSKSGRWLPAQSLLTVLNDIREHASRGLSPDWVDAMIIGNIDAKELGNAINASGFSTSLVSEYLRKYKFRTWINHQSNGTLVTEEEKESKAKEIAQKLCDHSRWLSHAKHISREAARTECGLRIVHPEDIGLARAIRRFWALVSLFLSKPIAKIFASENYILIRNGRGEP